MPYKNLEITPSNYNSQHTNQLTHYYKGFSTVNPDNRSSKLYDFNLIKQNILNHFNTRKGSRLMNPTFGTIIWDVLMEPLTPQIRSALTKDIEEICNLDPRVYPTLINVNEYERGYLIEVSLSMKNTDQSSSMRMVFDQKIGLKLQ
jgi:phage baseplate assembly protein W